MESAYTEHRNYDVNYDTLYPSSKTSLVEFEALNMENVYTTSKPFLSFSKVFGLFPISFEGSVRRGSLKFKWINLIFTFCLFASLTYLEIELSRRVVSFWSEFSLLDKIWSSLTQVQLLSFFWTFCYQIFKSKNTLKFLQLINSFDENVRKR